MILVVIEKGIFANTLYGCRSRRGAQKIAVDQAHVGQALQA